MLCSKGSRCKLISREIKDRLIVLRSNLNPYYIPASRLSKDDRLQRMLFRFRREIDLLNKKYVQYNIYLQKRKLQLGENLTYKEQ